MDQNRFVIKLKFELSSKVQFAGYFKMKFQNYSAMKLSISIFQQFPDQLNGEFILVKLVMFVGLNILHATLKNLSFKNGIHEKIEFSVTDQQKRDTTEVSFWNCEAVDFVDIEILKRFPNLNGLQFLGSNIPSLKNIFTVELKMIQYLDLWSNKIKVLEAHVFDELVELQWIDLSTNEIKEILHPIFVKNKKLEYISLSTNKIQTLHPNLFEGLPRLEEVRFQWNRKIYKKFDQSNMKMLKEELKPLFHNYLLKFEGRFKELELVS
jgi:hypothetical protein